MPSFVGHPACGESKKNLICQRTNTFRDGDAIKFTSAPGTITVSLERATSDDIALVRVRDTGVGIRPEMLSQVFEPFYQGPQDAARSTGGLGLGLALVQGIVRLHEGSIEVHSRGSDTGTEFVVRLPLASRPQSARQEHAPAKVPPTRILLVEDNADIAEMLHDLLRLVGHETSIAGSGPEALRMLREGSFEVVLCDLGLPGMSGYELARTILDDASLRGLRLVALTGYGQPEDRERSAEAGFDDHLTKPVRLDSLQEVLNRLAARRD